MRNALLFLAAGAIAFALVLDLCGLLYGCGCRSWWAGAASHCNIHLPGHPDCPWCTLGYGQMAAFIALPIGAAQAASIWALRRRPAWLRFGAAVCAFPLAGILSAVAVGLWRGYWR